MTAETIPPPITPILPLPSTPAPIDAGAEFRRWARILLARNPFYILSAALLVWSMRRLSLDSRIFPDELPQLLFNFSSFQVYELLLAGTAIILARRCIWYESGLLVGLENLFICVPFLLVSQALLLENWIALTLCLTGCGLVVLRIGAMKRWLKELNMPASLLWSGALLLCFNLVWPLAIRLMHKDLSVPFWDQRGLTVVSLQWNLIIPAAIALGALLPMGMTEDAPPEDEERPFFAWRSFPLLVLLMWIAGTGVHLYCISYVYGLPWRVVWLVPAAWTAAWLLWWHSGNFASGLWRARLSRVLLFPPMLIVLASVWSGIPATCLVLAVLNAAACGLIAYLKRDRVAGHLCTVSALLACMLLPVPHPAAMAGSLSMVPALLGAGLCYLVGWAVLSPRPKLGIVGGICLGLLLARVLPSTALAMNLAVQAGLVFILLHSLRWSGSDAARARTMAGFYWLAHSIVWVAVDPVIAIPGTAGCGAAVLAFYTIVRVLRGKWGPTVIAYCAAAVLVWGPIFLAGRGLMRAPEGLRALIFSFALFGIGTVAALLKARFAEVAKAPKRLAGSVMPPR